MSTATEVPILDALREQSETLDRLLDLAREEAEHVGSSRPPRRDVEAERARLVACLATIERSLPPESDRGPMGPDESRLLRENRDRARALAESTERLLAGWAERREQIRGELGTVRDARGLLRAASAGSAPGGGLDVEALTSASSASTSSSRFIFSTNVVRLSFSSSAARDLFPPERARLWRIISRSRRETVAFRSIPSAVSRTTERSTPLRRSPISQGRSRRSMDSRPRATTMACSTAFSSSRTLPRHGWDTSRSRASGVRVFGRTPFRWAKACTNRSASSGMSSRLSRRGGTVIPSTWSL